VVGVLKASKVAATAAAMSVVMALGGQAALAQGGQPAALSANVQAFNACTTTNYADVASKALGISSAELRKAVVSGQTLQDIAKSKNVDVQTVLTAIQMARKAEAAQAVKDGLITQAEATAMESIGAGPVGTPPAAGQAAQGNAQGGQKGGQPPQGGAGAPGGQQGNQPGGQPPQQGNAQAISPLPDISTLRFLMQAVTPAAPAAGQQPMGPMGGFGGGTEQFNVVNPYAVAATSLNMKCTDLVKSLVGTSGKTITAVATEKKVDTKVVTDALTKAYKDALAQDVTNTIITQAQSDQAAKTLDKAVTSFVSNVRRSPMMP